MLNCRVAVILYFRHYSLFLIDITKTEEHPDTCFKVSKVYTPSAHALGSCSTNQKRQSVVA